MNFLLVTGKSSSIEMEKKALQDIKKYKIPHKVLNFNSYKFNIINDFFFNNFFFKHYKKI